MSIVTILPALLAVVAAVPTGSTSSQCSKISSQNANFDDLTGIPGDALNTIPTGYKGLYFQGFTFSSVVQTNLLPGPVPHSPTNYATSSSMTTALQGSPELTTNYQGSQVKSFTPQSFYYACALNLGNGATAPAVDCNIAVTGFKTGDVTGEAVQVAAQEFSYDSTTQTGVQQQTKGTFNWNFKDVEYILFQYTNEGGLGASNGDLILLIDDVKYTLCS